MTHCLQCKSSLGVYNSGREVSDDDSHTSGSTGFPKHLIYTHATAIRNAKMMSLKPPSGYASQDQAYQGKRVFLTFPPFHVCSIQIYAFIGVYNLTGRLSCQLSLQCCPFRHHNDLSYLGNDSLRRGFGPRLIADTG